MTKQELIQLSKKFMAGETSLSEERLLAEYLQQHPDAPELSDIAPMFALFATGMPIQGKERKIKRTVWLRWWVAASAACIAVVLGLWFAHLRPTTEQQPLVAESTPPSDAQPNLGPRLGGEAGHAPSQPEEDTPKSETRTPRRCRDVGMPRLSNAQPIDIQDAETGHAPSLQGQTHTIEQLLAEQEAAAAEAEAQMMQLALAAEILVEMVASTDYTLAETIERW